MNEDTRLILEKLSGLDVKITNLDTNVMELGIRVTNLESNVSDLRVAVTDLKTQFSSLDAKVSSHDIKFSSLDAKISSLDAKITTVQLTMENEISRKIDVIGEGHDFLKRRLDEALNLEKDKERMDLEILNLRMESNKIKDKLEIA